MKYAFRCSLYSIPDPVSLHTVRQQQAQIKDGQNLLFYKYITRQNKIANLLQNRGFGYMKILHFSSIINLPNKHQSLQINNSTQIH